MSDDELAALEEERRRILEQLELFGDDDADEADTVLPPPPKCPRLDSPPAPPPPPPPPLDELSQEKPMKINQAKHRSSRIHNSQNSSSSQPPVPSKDSVSPLQNETLSSSSCPCPFSERFSKTKKGVGSDDFPEGEASNHPGSPSGTNRMDTEEMEKDSACSAGDSRLSQENETSRDADDLDIEEMLESVDNPKEEFYYKTVLETMENDHFDNLPDGWCRITHNCGLPLYLHKESRVITVSRPYFIGPDSVRQHLIPLAAVPCLHQKRVNEKKEQQKELERHTTDEFGQKLLQQLPAPSVRIERLEEYRLKPEELNEYASSIYKFKRIKVAKYSSFRHRKMKKVEEREAKSLEKAGFTQNELQGAEGPIKTASGIALINVPTMDNRFHRKNFVMNPTGRSSLTILHEYVQRALKGKIRYDIDERSSSTTFSTAAILFIKKSIRVQAAPTLKEKLALVATREKVVTRPDWNIEPDEDVLILGRGEAPSKKVAKMIAAEMALKILIPDIQFDSEHKAFLVDPEVGNEQSYDIKSISLFDQLSITDPRVTDMCIKTGLLRPYILLKEAIARSITLSGAALDTKHDLITDQQSRLTITVGPYSATVTAIGVRTAKQRAAQEVLQQMHPELTSYSSLLRLYASAEERAEKRDATRNHDQVVRLQNRGPANEPNHAVIAKLRELMSGISSSKKKRPPGATISRDVVSA